MKLLRRTLYWDAAVSTLLGVVLALVPAWTLRSLFDQPPLTEYAWVRIVGIEAVGLAMLKVLVAHRIEELWWFTWAFVLAGGAVALLCALNAVVGLPAGSPPVLWWVLAGLYALFTVSLVAGLAKTGTERPPF